VKFLCLDCDEPMRLHATEGPDAGSLTVTFRCPSCGFRVAMLTNPLETQLVRSLGVTIGGPAQPAGPFEHLRSMMARARADAFTAPAAAAGPAEPGPPEPGPPVEAAPDAAAAAPASGSGCPFARMLEAGPPAPPAQPTWTPEAEARLARVPDFIRPMARRAIERYAEGRGYAAITEAVMEEARAAFGV